MQKHDLDPNTLNYKVHAEAYCRSWITMVMDPVEPARKVSLATPADGQGQAGWRSADHMIVNRPANFVLRP